MDFWTLFSSTKGKSSMKWAPFMMAYERHLSRFKHVPLTLFEIGVSGGGSLALWKKYLGPMAQIVGIDVNSNCKEHENPECGIFVEIGDQSDKKFLSKLIDDYDFPDIVIDDGSHLMNHQISTFEFLYPNVNENGIYAVEDTHTSYLPEWGGGDKNKENWMEYSKDLVDDLHAEVGQYRGAFGYPWKDFLPKENDFKKMTLSMHYYDSLVIFEKGKFNGRLWHSGELA